MMVVFTVAMLSACRSGPRAVGETAYGPRGAQGVGYSDLQMDERTAQVTFVGATPQDARDGVMRRAASVTMARGFDGFMILASEDHEEQAVRKRLVLGRVRRELSGRTLTIRMLRRGEDSGGAPVVDAHILVGPIADGVQ